MDEGAAREQAVLVTGGAGYPASGMAARLPGQGGRVRTAVRSVSREAEHRAAVARRTQGNERLLAVPAQVIPAARGSDPWRPLHVERESVSTSRHGPALFCGGWRSAYPPYTVRNRAQVKVFAAWYHTRAGRSGRGDDLALGGFRHGLGRFKAGSGVRPWRAAMGMPCATTDGSGCRAWFRAGGSCRRSPSRTSQGALAGGVSTGDGANPGRRPQRSAAESLRARDKLPPTRADLLGSPPQGLPVPARLHPVGQDAAVNVPDIPQAAQRHGDVELLADDVQRKGDALLTQGAQPV